MDFCSRAWLCVTESNNPALVVDVVRLDEQDAVRAPDDLRQVEVVDGLGVGLLRRRHQRAQRDRRRARRLP